MKKLGINIAELSAIIFIYGLLKLIFYYNSFGISITNFITISEIGLLISEDLLIIIPLCSVFIIMWVSFINVAEEEWEIRRTKKFAFHPINFSFAMSFFVLFSIFFYWILFDRIYRGSIILYSIICIIISLVLIFYKNIKLLRENSTASSFVLVVLFVTASLIFSTAFQLKNTFKGKYNNTTLITKDSTVYISSDTVAYIGKTENYIFFYRKKNRTTEIIPVSEIKFFRIHTLTDKEMNKIKAIHL
jgi:hypothetical protein